MLLFSLELEIADEAVQEMHQNKKNVWFQWQCFCGDDTHAFLHLFSSNGYGANVSEAVGKIATDEKDYHKYSLCVIVC